MATTSDRPKPGAPAHLPPDARPPELPETPVWTPTHTRVPRPNHPGDRFRARLYLFGPGVFLILGVLSLAAVTLALALGGSGQVPPATGAAELVPGNALLYLHVSTDPSRPAVQQTLALSRRLPGSALLFAAVTDRLDAGLAGSATAPVSFQTDVRPWLGREAALAVLDTPGASAGSLILLDVRRPALARRFLTSLGVQPDGAYRGVSLYAESGGTVLSFVRHYLVLGQAASVQAAIDVAQGKARSLAGSPGYRQAAGGESPDRVLDAYASADGVRRALIPRPGLLGDLGALLDQPPLRAAAISISPAGSGLRVDVHSTFLAKLADLAAYRPVQFGPSLAGVLPAHSMLLVDAKDLRTSAPKLLAVAARAGILGRIPSLLGRLGSALSAQGVDVRQVLGVFSGETALAIVPGRNGGGPVPVVVTRTSDEARTRAILANLEGPLAQVFTPSGNAPGVVPIISDARSAGLPVHELSLAPGFGLAYAVAHGLVVVSTGLAGVSAVFRHAGALSAASGFRSVLADRPSRATSLVFFDLRQLLRLGEQTGLIGSPRQSLLWSAVERIRAVGLTSWRGAKDTTTQLQLEIP